MFLFKNIEAIEADLSLTESRGVPSDFVTMTTPVMMIVTNTIAVQHKDGHIKKFSTNIYGNAYQEAFQAMRKVSNINIVINNIPFN